jgi:tRNA pseudouridine13 synthase
VSLRLRESPEDFRVDELPAYAPSGSGAHTFVRIEKRLRTTEEVARALARAAGVRPGDVGYAGRKDRVALTTQWFSVPGLDPARALALELAGARVLEAAPHPHKLRTGHLRGNRFEIAVRGADAAVADAARARLAQAVARGFPNRYGPQRYGRDGDNAERARALLAGGASRLARRDARFLLSALQARVFDTALAARELPLDALEPGDLAMKHDSGGVFLVEDAAREAPRAAAFEISATGPIFGTHMTEPGGAVAARERRALEACGVLDTGALRLPPGIRLRGARRALRERPRDAGTLLEGDVLRLRFELPAGSYASVLVEELVGAVAPLD